MKQSELHDALLEKIEINWQTKACSMSLRGDGSRWEIHVKAFSELIFPKAEPWGPSSSINSVKHSEVGLEIEMQSGDVLILRGKADILKLSN